MAERRHGKPYIWVTWLAKMLGGRQCRWSLWFMAHFKYDKFEERATDLPRWNREHTDLMRRRRAALEADGWIVTAEEQNQFKLNGQSAVVAGKMDLVAVKGDRVLVSDGKTGREREADIWQVFTYLYALPRMRPEIAGLQLEGEVYYKSGAVFTVTASDLTPARLDDLVSMIRIASSETAPPRSPSREECRNCNIGKADCPARVTEEQEAVAVGEF